MGYIKDYWNDKDKRAEQARKHTKEMEEKYSNDIKKSIKNTTIHFNGVRIIPKNNHKTTILIDDIDTVGGAQKYLDGKTAVLNFASYKNPGGMFIKGSKAQEECLCHASYLYNVLGEFNNSFYEWNNRHKNRSLYLNRGLYSPDITFELDNKTFKADVITVPAPNKSAAQKYQNVSDEENSEVLEDRIKFVLDIAAYHKVDTLILGAFGCGVFGQDATEVAAIFRTYLKTLYLGCFKTVVFAIPKGKDCNLKYFMEVFNRYSTNPDINEK